jgi:hypothetical protein
MDDVGFSRTGRGQRAGLPHHLGVSPQPSEDARRPFRAVAAAGAAAGRDEAGPGGDRRQQDQGERQRADGDELPRIKEEEQRLREEARRLLAEAQQVDKDEDKRYRRFSRGDELTTELDQAGAGLLAVPAARRGKGARRVGAGVHDSQPR